MKAEGSQEAMVEVKGASSGDVRAVGSRGRERENSVTGKGCSGIIQQGGLVRRRKNHSCLFSSFSSALSPTTCCLARIFLLTIILHLAGTDKSGAAHGAGN